MWRAWVNLMQAWWGEQRGSQGTMAAAAALAAALIAVGLGTGAHTYIAPAVEQAMDCAAAVLQGGGATCDPAANDAAAGDAAATDVEAADDSLSQDFVDGMAQFFEDVQNGDIGWLLDQLWGVLKGFGLSAWDMLTGLGDLGKDLWGLVSGDAETRAKYANLIQAFREDPVAMLKAMGEGVLAPIQEAWARGDYGEAAGRVLFELVSAVVGDKGLGKVAKAGKVEDILAWARAAERGEDVSDAGQVVRRLPCVGLVAPAGKVPGLGAPLAGCDDVGALTQKLDNGDLLTRNEWDQLIDNPPVGKTPDDMRYERYLQDKATEGKPPLDRDTWETRKAQLEANRQRGRIDEDNTINELGIDNNNYNKTSDGQTRDITTYTSSDGVTVRPDGVSDSHWIDVKSTSDDTFYFDQQLRAQAEGAAQGNKRLAVVLTNDGSKIPSPSGPLGRNADVFYRNSSTGEWMRWNQQANGRKGGWEIVPTADAQQLLSSTP